MPTRRAANPRTNKREVILHAALRLFAERGYDGTGIEDIAAAVDITGPGLYRHFQSKEEILITAFSDAGQLMLHGLVQSKGQEPEEALQTLARSHATMAVKQGQWIQIWLREGHRLPKQWSDDSKKVQLSYVSWFGEVIGQVRKDLSDQERIETVHAVISVLNSAAFYRPAMSEQRRIDYLAQSAIALVHAAPTSKKKTTSRVAPEPTS